MSLELSIKDANGNTIIKGDKVNVVVAGEFKYQAIFNWCIGGLVTLQNGLNLFVDQMPRFNVYKAM